MKNEKILGHSGGMCLCIVFCNLELCSKSCWPGEDKHIHLFRSGDHSCRIGDSFERASDKTGGYWNNSDFGWIIDIRI